MFGELTIEQLLILQRGLLEAKFSPNPRDTALRGSAILAELSSSIVDTIRERYTREGDAARARQWSEWSRWAKRTAERELVLDHLRGLEAWRRMSNEVRSSYIRALIAPFEATDDEVAELIHAADMDEG
jgi:hypothetical protein